MSDRFEVNGKTLRVDRGDITDLEVESFVFYAQHDLQLGSGFGTAISIRGGPGVQEELNELAPLETTQVAISAGGGLKAKHIIHAVGPRFQEEGIEAKLVTTIRNCLKQAEEKGIKQIAFPPMGSGFYGVPLPISADVTVQTIHDYLAGDTEIRDVVVVANDNRERLALQQKLAALDASVARA
jgi:O-acetyl-ADP-ribose deacetylase (regulator of RNase III)